MKTNPVIAIIGAGAAGMLAAITARRLGSRVLLVERQDRVGKKLLATGNGRCNLSNVNCSVSNFHGADPSFVKPALDQFPVSKTVEFFEELGICTMVEDAGKIFPITGQASAVLDVLRAEVGRLGVELSTEKTVQAIVRKGESFLLRLNDGSITVDKVIVACGSMAGPHLGGNDSGMGLLKSLGHSVIPTFPALVPLKTSCRFNKHLKGTKVDATGVLYVQGKPCASETGEYLFTDYGLSGPPVLQLSQAANRALVQGQKVSIGLDLFPAWSEADLIAHLKKRLICRPESQLDFILVGLVHKRLISAILGEAKIADSRMPASRVSPNETAAIARILKSWVFDITGSLTWKDAQLMAGGIAVKDFSAQTLESRIVPGLYAVGEVLDVSGDCGGYNLQWAWSSGHVAATHAAGI